MMIMSFQSFDPIKLVTTEFTLANYRAIFFDPYIRGILLRTLRISIISTLFCAIIGFPVAWRMRQASGKEKMLISLIISTPLMVSLVILAYAFMLIMAPNTGIISSITRSIFGKPFSIMYTEVGVIVGLVYSNCVFMIISLHAALENLDESLLRAAKIHGANSIQVFIRVILPLSLPGLVSGSLLVFSICTSAFMTPYIIGGRQIPVLATYAYDMATLTLNWPSAAAIAAILVLIGFTVVYIYSSWIWRIELRLGVGE